MDLGPPLFSACVLLIVLLGVERCSSGDDINCACEGIAPMNLTKPPSETCSSTSTRFRYRCITGFSRMAGTSDLITCKLINGVPQWYPQTPSLKCIRQAVPPEACSIAVGCGSVEQSTTSCIYRAAVSSWPHNETVRAGMTLNPKYTDPKITTTPAPKPPEPTAHTDIPPDSIIPTTVIAANNNSLQMDQSEIPSTSVSTTVRDRSETTQVPTDHTQIAANNSLQMDQSEIPSTWVSTTVRDRSETTQVPTDHTQTYSVLETTSTSTTSEPLDNKTVNPRVSNPTNNGATTAVIACVSLVVVVALIGVGFWWCYKRRSANNTQMHTVEEQMPMNVVESGTPP